MNLIIDFADTNEKREFIFAEKENISEKVTASTFIRFNKPGQSFGVKGT